MKRVRVVAPLIPYVAVVVGLYGARSAGIALCLYHAGILSVVLRDRCRYDGRTKKLAWYWWLIAAVVVALGGVLLFALWPLLGEDADNVPTRLALVGVTPATWPYLVAYFCLANAVFEELFWRGSLGSASESITLNDMLFGGYHSLVLLFFASAVWVVPVLAACVFAAWFWRRLKRTSGSLLLPMVTHIVADTSIAIAVTLRVFGSQ